MTTLTPYLTSAPRPSAATFWRRRFAALILAAVATIAAVSLLGRLDAGPLSGAEPVPARPAATGAPVYVVQPGDTLWSIARSLQPEGDVRPLVDRLAAQLRGRNLAAGDRIVLR